jgi:putative SbcD/Mre11-related phosphoesterase
LLKLVPGEAAIIFKADSESTLLVSDLHLGLEKELASKGFRMPSYSLKMMDRIKKVAEEYRCQKAVILGDVKHTIGKAQDIDWSVVPWFFSTLTDLFSSVEVVPGNHDGGIGPLLPRNVKLDKSNGAVIGSEKERVGLSHGHAWPSEAVISTGKMVLGHSHFTYELRDKFGGRSREAVWLFAKYSINELLKAAGYLPGRPGSGELVVMPPFNRMVGGQPINTGLSFEFGPVLSSGYVDIKTSDIFLLDGTRVS